jgi:hypothetical protein
MAIRRTDIMAFAVAVFLAGCAQPTPAPVAADRFYDCSDTNGPIGTLQLTGDHRALITEANSAAGTKPEVLGTYREQDGKIQVYTTDIGEIDYKLDATGFSSDLPPDAPAWMSRVTCVTRHQ